MAFTLEGIRGWETGQRMQGTADVSNTANVTVETTEVHTGSYALRIGNHAHWVRYEFSTTPANPSIGIWIDAQDGYDDDDGIRLRFQLTSGEYIGLRWDATNHTFDAYVDGAKVADGSVSVGSNDWFNVQFKAVIADSGSIDVLINGQSSISYSGDTLPVAATAQVEYIYLWSDAETWYKYFDDFVWGYGTDHPGDVRVDYLTPTADTAVDDFTASAGDSFECVNEKPPNDGTDYISSSTNGHATELDLSDFTGTNKTIMGINVIAKAQEDAATAEQLGLGVDSNGTDSTANRTLTTTWAYYENLIDDNPDDSLEWEDADLDALKVRVEAVI
jgi:hypothetical protein